MNIRGFHQKTLRNIEVLASKNGGSDKAIIEAMRAIRDSGKWGSEVSLKQIDLSKAKKIAGKKKVTETPQTKIFKGKKYTLLKELKNKREVNAFKNNCENACYFMRTIKPKNSKDTYKIYGRKTK
jgi:hypothetical protein